MNRSKLTKVGAVGAACAAIGAGAGVLGSASAAPSGNGTAAAAQHHKGKHHKSAKKLLNRTVHADFVVPVKGGKFARVTIDRGFVQKVSGRQLTVREGTRKATYRTVTLTIPANAKVRDDGQAASLSAVKPGQRVMVFHGPKRTRVAAHDVRSK